MHRTGPRIAAALSVALVLGGCSGNPVTDTNSDIEFTSCSETECSGVLPSGAEFEILLPEEWNGSLALYSHGLRGVTLPSATDSPSPSPQESATTSPSPSRSQGASPEPSARLPRPRPGGPEPAPRWGAGDNTIADVMLQAGYAVAGAAPPAQGWSVRAQIVAAEELHDYFDDQIGTPNRVYAWGESTGGLASARLAELHPDWVSGVVAMCAPMSGPVPTFDLALDTAFAVRELLVPDLQLVGYGSVEDARKARNRAIAAVRRTAASGAEGQATVLFLASLVSLPLKTSTEPGLTLAGQVGAAAEGLANLLDQSTVQRYQLEQLVGGNPSGNEGTDYQLRISTQRRGQINMVAPGSTRRLYAELNKGERIVADEEAMRAAAVQGELTGELEVPVLTLHNAFDPVYIAQNESWYRERVSTVGPEASANLVDLYALPPASYSAEETALEGAGNCSFEPRTQVGVVIQLDQWVRKEQYPGRDSIAKAFAGQDVTLDYDPGPWPAMAVSPTDPPLAPEPDEVFSPTSSPASSATGGSTSASPQRLDDRSGGQKGSRPATDR